MRPGARYPAPACGLKDTISVEDIELPQGVECALRPKLTLVIVLEARKITEEAEEVAEAAAAPEGAAAAAEPVAPAGDADEAAS